MRTGSTTPPLPTDPLPEVRHAAYPLPMRLIYDQKAEQLREYSPRFDRQARYDSSFTVAMNAIANAFDTVKKNMQGTFCGVTFTEEIRQPLLSEIESAPHSPISGPSHSYEPSVMNIPNLSV